MRDAKFLVESFCLICTERIILLNKSNKGKSGSKKSNSIISNEDKEKSLNTTVASSSSDLSLTPDVGGAKDSKPKY